MINWLKWWLYINLFRNDPTRLLVTLGASQSSVDKLHHNTPLHWAVYSHNGVGVSILLRAGANIMAKNAHGDTPLEMAKKFQAKYLIHRLEQAYHEKEVKNKSFFHRLFHDKEIKYWLMIGSPFMFFYAFGATFDLEQTILVKLFLLLFITSICYLVYKYFFDERMFNILPMSIYLATKFWLFLTCFTYFTPCKLFFKNLP